MMKRTMLVAFVALALVMSTMAGAMARGNGAIQGTAPDANVPALGEVDYLFNNAGYHFWFTATADLGPYEADNAYHNIYKYSPDDPWNWCGPVPIPDRLPYNAGGTAGETAYYKIWNVTTDSWVCGGDNTVVSGQLDSSDADGITVDIPLSWDGNYGTFELEVSGTWQNGPHWLVDAVCVEQGSEGARNGSLDPADRIWLRTWESGSYVDPPFGDVLVDSVSPWTQTDADCPDADHTYTTTVTVSGGSVHLAVYDSGHADNVGMLGYTLTRVG